jgi:hypothetical protein
MSYTPIRTAITTGTRRLHTLGSLWGMGWLGTAPDPDTVAELVSAGYDQDEINMAIQMGATNEQLLALPYPADPATEAMAVADLVNQLGAGAAQPVSTAVPAPSPSSGNVLRAGSQLSYTATWGNNFFSWNDPNGIQSKIQPVLSAQWGIEIDNQFHTTSDIINLSGQSGFTLQVHTTRDYGSVGDIKSIIDGALYNAGVSLKSSTIALTVTGVTPLVTGPVPGAAGTAIAMTPLTPAGATNWSAWLQTNMPVLLFAIAAIAIVPPLLRRR